MTNPPPNGRPSPWGFRRRPFVLALLVDGLLAAVLVAAGTTIPLRAVAVFVFLMLAPGVAVTGFLRLDEPATELAVAIPLSLALDVAVAAGMSLATVWRPDVALLGSVLITSAALAWQVYRDRPAVDRPRSDQRLAQAYQRWLRHGDGGARSDIRDDKERPREQGVKDPT